MSHLLLFPQGAGQVKFIATNLRLYASRYIRVALRMYCCVPDSKGFYLIGMNDSPMPDFGGIKLGIVRRCPTARLLMPPATP